jgi:hypothetical protein
VNEPSHPTSKEQVAREAYERWHQGRSPDDLAGQLWRSGYMSAVVDGRRPPETSAEDQHSAKVQFEKYHAMQGLLVTIAHSTSPYRERAAAILAGDFSEKTGAES